MNNKNVFILGAGFSMPIGIPSISQFYNVIKKIYLDGAKDLDNGLMKSFQSIIEYRKSLDKVSAKTNIDLDNIETLFSYLEMDCECNPRQELGVIRNNLIYTIINTLKLSTNIKLIESSDPQGTVKSIKGYFGKDNVKYEKDKKLNYTVNMYEYFVCLMAGIIGKRNYPYDYNDTIITFNYDTILDDIFEKQEVQIDYGYEGQDKGLKYLKLHGSANWLFCNKCKRIYLYDQGYPKRITKGCKYCKDNKATRNPLIVPPSWNKSEYREQIKRIWETAVRELTKARKIFIIGYSVPMTDMYFEYLISLGLKENDILEKIVVVDREYEATNNDDQEYIKKLDEKYRRLLDINFAKYRYEFKSIGVYQFIMNEIINYIGCRES